MKELFSLNKINYYIYRDDEFLRNIYSQIFRDLPSLGIVEYKGSNTHLYSREIKGFAEEENEDLLTTNEDDCNNAFKNSDKILTEIKFSDTDGVNINREYTNISEIKKINIESLLKTYIKEVRNKCKCDDENIVEIKGNLSIYSYKEEAKDIFLKIEKDIVWVKKELLDSDINILCNILDEVNVIGYVIRNKKDEDYRIIKAIVICI